MRKTAVILALCMNAFAISEQAIASSEKNVDVLLIGGGVMSATLGTYLSELEPGWSIAMVERLDKVAQESSEGWNNAGTGHSALAELNYTPEKNDGTIDIEKAVEINEAFQISRQFWAYHVQKGTLHNPGSFINSTPHMSFVCGDTDITFLHKRYEALQKSTLFRGMHYSEDPQQIKRWIPLVMEGRDASQKVAATRIPIGTDVNFGEITRQLVASLAKSQNFNLQTSHEVRDLRRNAEGNWSITVADLKNGRTERVINAKYVFIGAGGASLPLLQKSGIPEAKAYAGFPVGGEFLVTENPEVVKRHQAKVYGKASTGAPPMSVPHLDTRILGGNQALLFGPFATFSSKYLKNGSLWDMFTSMTAANLMPMMHAGIDNYGLVKYLIGQLMLNDEDRYQALKEYYPEAKKEDWHLITGGQRVQIIKKDAEKGGVLRLGTEVVSSQDGTLSALLGASPGASTSASIILDLMSNVFKDKITTPAWQQKLQAMIPSYGQKLNGNRAAIEKELAETSHILQLDTQPEDAAVHDLTTTDPASEE